jgi:hypothetical protein
MLVLPLAFPSAPRQGGGREVRRALTTFLQIIFREENMSARRQRAAFSIARAGTLVVEINLP